MNSLPFISHHLFVTAVASEDRACARPVRCDRQSVEPVAPSTVIPLELLDDRQAVPAGAKYPLRASVARARE